ncbi:MAG TPA: hypothetical protein VEF53_16830 [Patescibacteria group bacterium]|nr:hypothetical protein [Patescibacteria group bacterium]
MILNILLMVLSLILGWYGREWIECYLKKREYNKLLCKAKFMKDRAEEWIVNYYDKEPNKNILYCLENGTKIPYITKKNWYGKNFNNTLTILLTDNETTYPINNKYIKERQLLNQNIWDGNVFCLDNIKEKENKINVYVGKCTYFQFVTAADHLAAETIKCIKRNNNMNATFRNKYFGNMHQLSNNCLKTQILGVTVAMLFRFEDSHYVLIQKRSSSVGVAKNTYAVVPSFVCNQPNNYPKKDINKIIFHFFLAELLEELFDYKSIIENKEYIIYDWFYNEYPVKELLNLQKKGSFKFKTLGMGFDAFTGELNIAAISVIEDIVFSKSITKNMKKNWEINDCQLIDINSEEFEQILYSKNTYTTTKFTLSILKKLYK